MTGQRGTKRSLSEKKKGSGDAPAGHVVREDQKKKGVIRRG